MEKNVLWKTAISFFLFFLPKFDVNDAKNHYLALVI